MLKFYKRKHFPSWMLLGNNVCMLQARHEHMLSTLGKPLVRPSARIIDQSWVKGMMSNPFLSPPRMRLICVGSERKYKHLINKTAQKILKNNKITGYEGQPCWKHRQKRVSWICSVAEDSMAHMELGRKKYTPCVGKTLCPLKPSV